MKPNAVVLRETRRLVIALLIIDALISGVFALLRRWDYTVVTGALLGTAAAALNFFLLGLTVQRAAEKSENPKRYAKLSYGLRMLLLAAILLCGILLPCFHTAAVLIPPLLQFPILLILNLRSKGK